MRIGLFLSIAFMLTAAASLTDRADLGAQDRPTFEPPPPPPAPKPQQSVVRCGVDEAFLNAEPTPIPDNKRLVLVAGFTEQKGHLLLIQALGQVAKAGHDFEMLFVGDGPLRSAIEAEIKKQGIEGKVRLPGWQPMRQVTIICGRRGHW